MEYSYLVRFSNAKVYKEVQLPIDASVYKIGFSTDCNARFFKDDFLTEFELTFDKVKNDEKSTSKEELYNHWQVSCSDGVYLEFVTDSKEFVKVLHHGYNFKIKDNENDSEILSVEFVFDFENETKNYDRVIDISGMSQVTLGGTADNAIVLNSNYAKVDSLVLKKKSKDVLELTINNTKYGVYHDGKKAVSGETILNGDFISIADFSFYYKDGKLYTEATDDVKVNGITALDSGLAGNYPKFIRNTRLNRVLSDEKIEILDPPAKPQEPKNNLFTRLLPSLGMIIMAVVMFTKGGGTMIIFSAVSAVSAIITAVLGVRESKKDYKKSTADRIEKYTKYIENKKTEIEDIRKCELDDLDKIYISQDEEKTNFATFSPNLFDRTIEDEDFLCVRLGTGSVDAKREINFKKQEKLEIEDDLQEKPAELSKEYKKISNAPVVCDFKLADAVGVVGDEEDRFDILKNIVLDITARHMFKDVKLFFIAEEEHKEKVKWLRMLPYAYNEAVGVRNVVTDGESKTLIFEYLYKELSAREQAKGFSERIVVFFFDEYGFNSHPISKFVNRCKDLGVTFVFFGEERAKIPVGIDYLIEVAGNGGAELIDTHDDKKNCKFSYPVISNEEAENTVNILAPVYVEDISLEAALTKSLTMFDLLNIIATDDINLGENWANSKVFKSMAAPIGVTTSDTVYLDLHDKAHGPHGLVAGTTGSGKSELLQTYILSMALLFSPEDVGFVIIDFKGGGMASQFRDYNEKHYRNLPHILGTITNIDGREIDRSLKSIKAELHKRERLFKEAGVNHIDNYIKDYKAGKLETPLPHLIVIVDEFAELKADYPDFMAELISAARTGRSLGVHLILATQKPAGQVSEQIWSNSRFKLCLKVQGPEDSNDMIKSPLAAEIKEAGRAYFQVGNNEIFELFQSAYTGGPEKINESSTKNVEIFELSDSGKRQKLRTKKATTESAKDGAEKVTQLSSIVNYIDNYCKKNNIAEIPDICLPSLPKVIDFPEEGTYSDQGVAIGVYDDPDNQYQGKTFLSINQNTFVIGSSQTGKTNLLQVMLRSLSTCSSPMENVFYIIDFGSMILKNYESLNHVGGVVTVTEEEKLRNLFKLLLREIETRKTKLLNLGVSSFSAYLEAGKHDVPHIVVMLDNFPVFKELYSDKFEDEFMYMLREGSTYGINFVVTSSTTNGVSYRYISNFGRKIAFSCNDNTEYASLFSRCRISPLETPGRALVEVDKNVKEAQIYLSFLGEKEIDRIDRIRSFVEKINNEYAGMVARKIPEVPNDLDANYISNNFEYDVKNQIAISMSYPNVEPIYFDIYNMMTLSIVGKLSKNVKNFEVALLKDLEKNYFERPVKLYIVDSIQRELRDYANLPYVEKYQLDFSNLEVVFNPILAELQDRFDTVVNEGIECLQELPLIVLLINNPEAFNHISSDDNLKENYIDITTKFKAMKVLVIVGSLEDETVGYSSPDLLKRIRDEKHSIICSNLTSHKLFDIPSQYVRQNKESLDYTQAFYLKESEITKIRFVNEVN